MKLEHIERALRDGAKLHAFMSGGGLRVIRVETAKGGLIGYGEHPDVMDALSHADEDTASSHRPYHEVYGVTKPHYLTGSSTPSNDLDAWLRRGSTFDVVARAGAYEATLSGYGETHAPDDVTRRAIAGETVEWEARGFKFISGPYTFPGNGERGCFTETTFVPEGKTDLQAHHFRITKTASARSVLGALDAALAAPSVEVDGL
jgi:hypothetical protein